MAPKPTERIDTVIGQIVVSKDEHLRCLNCIRYRASRQKPGAGYCTRTLFDENGTFLGRANEDVLENYWCNQFRSRLGEQQQ